MPIILAGGLIAGLFCIAVIGQTVLGAFVGWLIGLFFENTILAIASQLGVKGVAMWQLGAFLGFVSGFFSSPSGSSRN